MSTVTAKIEPAQRIGDAARRAADRAGDASRRPRAGSSGGRQDLRRGRPGQRALGSREADRPDASRPISVEQPRRAREGRGEQAPSCLATLLLARGQDGARDRRVAGHRPGDRASSSRAQAPTSSSAIAPARRRPRPSPRDRRPRRSGGRRRPGRGAGARRGGRRPRHPRQQRGLTRDGVLARMTDDDWRDGDRDEPEQRLLHLPRGVARDDEAARAARS